ncbi:MAG: ABC transporter substrate-binding protein, partial [Chloroflexota bacterium]|nr:ABC transporter substrate-binding protein [Chloroflexota bacterium]
GNMLLQYFTNFHEGIGVFSKKVFDKYGPEGMRDILIGTGPFEMKEWTQFKGSYVTAVENHWRKTPYVAQVNTIEVPEGLVRRSMLEAGQAHIGSVPISEWPKLFAAGLQKAPEGFPGSASVCYSGNYWEKTHAKTGEALARTLENKPWIGNPADAASMEKAKKVRRALTLAIDREAINKKVFGGFGKPVYAIAIDDTNPLYQKRWETVYDPVKAKQLLTEAGYPNGFKVDPYYNNPAGTVDMAEAIGVTWKNDLNIDVTYDRQTYATFRPSIVNRTFSGMFDGGCGGPGAFPPTWPYGLNSSSLTFPGGYSNGLEIPKFTETFLKMNGEPDEAKLVKAITELNDYNLEWRLYAPIVALPNYAIYNPKKIVEWKMVPEAKGLHGGVNQPEYIKLAP